MKALSAESRDHCVTLCHQVHGIIAVLQSAAFSNDQPNGEDVGATCWVATNLLDEMLRTLDRPEQPA